MQENIVNTLLNNVEAVLKTAAKLISYPSVENKPLPNMPFGQACADCLSEALSICASFGMRTKNIDGYVGYSEIGEGDELIGILTHLDVVPVGDDWDYPPFELSLEDDKLYGRGIVDDKGPAAMCIHILKEINASNIKLNRRIRIIFGLNEETGWACVKRYIQTEELPTYGFTPDAEFPVIKGEKGILGLKISSLQPHDNLIKSLTGGNAINSVPSFARAVLNDETIIESEGKAAHGSMPRLGENAISKLVGLLNDQRLILDNNLLKFYLDYIKEETNGELLGINFSDEQSGPLTLNVGMININDQECNMEIDIRYPISFTDKTIITKLEPILAKYDLKLEVLSHQKPIYLSDDNFLVKELLDVYNQATNTNESSVVIGGGTYARAMDNIVAFGPMFPNRYDSAHQKNEHMLVQDFSKCLEIYTKAILRLLDNK